MAIWNIKLDRCFSANNFLFLFANFLLLSWSIQSTSIYCFVRQHYYCWCFCEQYKFNLTLISHRQLQYITIYVTSEPGWNRKISNKHFKNLDTKFLFLLIYMYIQMNIEWNEDDTRDYIKLFLLDILCRVIIWLLTELQSW